MSTSVVNVRSVGPGLVITSVNVKFPPGSGRCSGATVLTISMSGAGVNVTTASSVSSTGLPFSSIASISAISVSVSPATPVKLPTNVQVTDESGFVDGSTSLSSGTQVLFVTFGLAALNRSP